jgi:hypothetical protein
VALGQFIPGLVTALLITRLYSLPYDLASSILGNDKSLWDEKDFAVNWVGMNNLEINCPRANIINYGLFAVIYGLQ